MTTAEWLLLQSPQELFDALNGKGSYRQFVLCHVASARELCPYLDDKSLSEAVDYAEKRCEYESGNPEEFRRIEWYAEAAIFRFEHVNECYEVIDRLAKPWPMRILNLFLMSDEPESHVQCHIVRRIASFIYEVLQLEFTQGERRRHLDGYYDPHYIKDVFANAFLSAESPSLSHPENAKLIAQSMYASRDFSAMPILADALEDAGCDDAAILAHCRDPQAVHVRGCWVVDLVLGKK